MINRYLKQNTILSILKSYFNLPAGRQVIYQRHLRSINPTLNHTNPRSIKPNYFILIIAVFSFISCTQPKPFTLSNPSELPGLASAIQLEYNGNRVQLQDYFMHPKNIDSIQIPEGLNVVWKKDSALVYLTGNIKTGMANARFYSGGQVFDIPVKRSAQIKYTYTFDPEDREIETLQIFGSFNAWNRSANSFRREDGVYQTDLVVYPGKYQYKLLLNGEEILDPHNTDSISNGMGGYNSVLQIDEENTDPIKITPDTIELNNIFIRTNKKAENIFVYWQNNLLGSKYINAVAEGLWIDIPVTEAAGRSFLRVWVADEKFVSNDLLIPLQDGKILKNYADLNRQDWEKSIFYFLMVDRFANGNTANDQKVDDPEILPQANYYGGDVAGVTQQLRDGYFDELGINTIWLSPITQNPTDAWGLWDKGGVRTKFSGYHGYWPVSNVLPDYRFATKAEIDELLKEAHARGMNVILDYVANHVHQSHVIYQNNKDWATDLYLPDGTMNTEKWDEHRLTTWFDTFLPTLDLRRPEVVEPLTDSALVWITDYDLDGFRHDATKHIDELYWRVLVRKTKERVSIPQHKRIYQIGETYGSPDLIKSYISSGMLDAQFDFNLYDASVATFAVADEPLDYLAEVLAASLENYGYHHLMGNISGNQDRSRFITLADGDLRFDEDQKLAGYTREFGKPAHYSSYQKLAMLHAFNFAVPGIPVIYYGDEYGMPGANDPDNRRQMLFTDLDKDELQLKAMVEKLTRLRKENLALIYGTTNISVSENGLLTIHRKYFDDEVWVVFNNSSEKKEIEIRTIEDFEHVFRTIEFGKTKNLIAPFSFEYLIKDNSL